MIERVFDRQAFCPCRIQKARIPTDKAGRQLLACQRALLT